MMRPQGLYIGVKENDETDLDEIENTEKLDDAHDNDELFNQFEDDLENGATETNHTIKIKLGGKEMYKSSIVRLISSGLGIKKSGDRLRRVQVISRFMSQKPDSPDVAENDNTIAVKDPVATCSKQGCLSLAVIFVEQDH